MSSKIGTFLRLTCMSIALLCAGAVAVAIVAPDAAYAKNDKSKKDKSKSKSKSKAKSKAKSKSKPKKTTRQVVVPKPTKTPKVFKGQGNALVQALAEAGYDYHPSDLGSLNAWNNNSENTNDQSVVGNLNLFKAAVAEGLLLKDDLQVAKDTLVDLMPEDETFALYDEDGQLTGFDLAAAEEAYLVGDLTQDAFDALVAYEMQRASIASLEQQYDDNLNLEAAFLQEAANKPVDEELLNAFRALLGAVED